CADRAHSPAGHRVRLHRRAVRPRLGAAAVLLPRDDRLRDPALARRRSREGRLRRALVCSRAPGHDADRLVAALGSPLGRAAGGAYLASSTCSKSSSTGVARPKIETPTLTLFLSKSSSSTRPLKLANGPSST